MWRSCERVKTVDNRFCRSDVSRCESAEPSVAGEGRRHKSRRGKKSHSATERKTHNEQYVYNVIFTALNINQNGIEYFAISKDTKAQIKISTYSNEFSKKVSDISLLDEDALVQIMTEPKNALTKQYKKLFELDNTELEFTDEALKTVLAVPRVFLPLVLKGCVDWARENGVELITEEHMKIINDKRAKEKNKK